MVTVGFLLPFLMVIGYVQSTFLLNFLAYGASFGGLIVGLIGAAYWGRQRRDRDDHNDW